MIQAEGLEESTKINTPFALLGIFSALGTIIRLLASFIPAKEMNPVTFPQMIGCFLFGFFDTQRELISTNNPNLLLALFSGLCGSITSFSSFAYSVYVAFGGLSSGFDVFSLITTDIKWLLLNRHGDWAVPSCIYDGISCWSIEINSDRHGGK